MEHTCIKPSCGHRYEDNDPDPYYCPECREENKKIAEEIDKKIGVRPKKHQNLSHFTEKDFKGRGGRIFFNARDI